MLTMQVGGCWPVRWKAWCSIWLEVIQRDSETFYPVLLFFFFQESPFLRLDEPPWFFSVNSGLFTKQQNIGTERRPPVLPTLSSAEQRHFRTYATPSDSPETMGKQFAVYTAVYPSRLACRTLLCTAPTLRFYVTKIAQFHQ